MTEHKAYLLLVHPNPGQRAQWVVDLQGRGYRVEGFSSSDDARQMLSAAKAGADTPRLVLWMLSGGTDLFPAAGATDTNPFPGLPVIAIGGKTHIASLSATAPGRFADFFIEPVDVDLLDLKIAQCLDRAGMEERLAVAQATTTRLMDDLQKVILPVGIALSVEKDLNRLLERILEEAKKLCRADAGTLYLRTEDNRLRFEIMRTDSLGIARGGTTGDKITFPGLPLYLEDGKPNIYNIATYVALHGQSVNIPNIYDSPDFDWSATKRFDQKNNYKSVSTLTSPLKNCAGEVIGVLQLFNCKDPKTGQSIPFDSYQQLVFESMASQASIVLSNQSLLKREQELLKYERELQIGQEIQKGFIPRELPQSPGWEVAAISQPARQVGGDFYDMFKLDDRYLVFVVADVCDKGVGAALFAALARSLLRAFTRQCTPSGPNCKPECVKQCAPKSLHPAMATYVEQCGIALAKSVCAVAQTNEYMIDVHADMNMFVTVFYGLLDLQTGDLIYVNGGHEAALGLGADGKIRTQLKSTGPAVGIFPGVDFLVAKKKMDPGDSLVIYTDGVTDARDAMGNGYGHERLEKLLTEPATGAEALLKRASNALNLHIGTANQFDDITLMVIRRQP